MKRSILITLLLVAFVMSLGVGFASADLKIYPGSMCVRWSGATPSYNVSAIGNPSTTAWLYVDCPCINDTAKGASNGSVVVLDMTTTGDVSCSLVSAYRGNNSWYAWYPNPATRTSTGISSNTQSLTFGSVYATSYSHYYYSCKVPPVKSGQVSYIDTYTLNEKD